MTARLPASVHRLRGNYRQDRDKPHPIAVPVCPEPPEFLSHGAKERWHEVAPELHRIKLLTHLDVAALASWAEVTEVALSAAHQLNDEGLLVEGRNRGGGQVANPVFRIWRSAVTTSLALAKELGLTPAARARIPLDEDLDEELDDLLD